MNIFDYGLPAQGFCLPKFSQTDKVQSVATLSKWQQGWRIKHPQAVTELGQCKSIPPISSTLLVIYLFLGAWVGSQRKRPRCAFPLCGTALRLPDPPLCLTHKGSLP